MAARNTPEQKIVATAIAVIEKSGWQSLTLMALAKKAKLPLETIYDICPSKQALLGLIGKEIDLKFLNAAPEVDETMSARDRAFDAILSWFEQLEPLRGALTVLREESKGDLSTLIDLAPITMRSAYWIAECAGISSTGWRGLITTRGLGLLLADTMNVWLQDEAGLARTMAHLDRRLRTLEEWGETINKARTNAAKDEDE